MANLNKVMLIGRLTRDPEVRTFTNGGKVAQFGFAVNNRKKNQETGQWEDVPVWLDVKTFNRGERGRQLADIVEQHFQKGRQFFIEGHLMLEEWNNQEGQKRSKLYIYMDDFQFLDTKGDGSGSGSYSGQPASYSTSPSSNQSFGSPEPEFNPPPSQEEGGDNIPF